MTAGRLRMALMLALLLGGPPLAWAQVPPRSVAPSSGPASVPAGPASSVAAQPSAPQREYRFDALRIDGALHGPEALTIRASAPSGQRPLARLRRSFVDRILQTLEDPCLHGGP